MLSIIFWLCIVGVITPYLIYPPILFLSSRFRRTRVPSSEPIPATFVISAYNEADVIAEKIKNTLALSYPRQLLQIVVISDESDDGTDEIVQGFPDVELIRQTPRKGKSAGINSAFDAFRGDVIVFSDANAIYDKDAVGHLVRHFGDKQVGYVVGRQTYYDGNDPAQQSENTYWDFELKLKQWESRLSSVVGGDGAIMAIRRELFSPLQADDINDFVLPLRIVAAGYRGRFEKQAVCYEEAAPSFKGEFRRKVRIVTRSLRAVSRVPQALNPFRVGIFAAQLFCHKVIRWFAAFFMAGALLSSAALAVQGSQLYIWIFFCQAFGYLVAIITNWIPLSRFRPAMLWFYFCMANIAGGLGVINFFVGRKFSTWTPQRDSDSNSHQTARG